MQQRSDRRSFLRWIGVTTITGVAAQATPALAAPGASKNTQICYRLSSHARHACSACRAHGAHRYFRTLQAIERAHKGCNCAIVPQPLATGTYRRYFHDGDVYDVRWKTAPGEAGLGKELLGASQR